MKKGITLFLILTITVMVFAGQFDLMPIVLSKSYNHDKWGTVPRDHVKEFAAFITSFDTADDDNGDGKSDLWGIPEWVAFEIKSVDTVEKLKKRPGTWISDRELHEAGEAPLDDTYKVPGVKQMKIVKTDYRFVRGHMCPKKTAERISADAAYNTHTVLNCVPQLQWQNNGIWKELENICTDYADTYGQVWVVCGPVFFQKNPSLWLGQAGEKQAAVPDALFKIVIKKSGDSIDTLAFLMPNIIPKNKGNLTSFLTSVDKIEELTGLDFLTRAGFDTTSIESSVAQSLWPSEAKPKQTTGKTKK